MEYIEKIADKVGEISISGGSNALKLHYTFYLKRKTLLMFPLIIF